MRDLLEKFATGNLATSEVAELETDGLIVWYDGYRLTTLGWVLLLRGRAPVEEIKTLLDLEEPGYLALLSELKEKEL